ncbi:MAG: helix-turn-helix domain-containing protein, partial [Oscillospiraceae bacterium]|nr:helix-turn-helix domain-containing protein [Oscillospiraceae bacterium]
MLDTNSTKHKHLTDEERQEIQDCLKHGMTFKDIARRIGKDQTTISKEVKKHITIRAGGGRKSMEDGTPIPPAITLQRRRKNHIKKRFTPRVKVLRLTRKPSGARTKSLQTAFAKVSICTTSSTRTNWGCQSQRSI